MRVAFDTWCIERQPFPSGASVYAKQLLRGLGGAQGSNSGLEVIPLSPSGEWETALHVSGEQGFNGNGPGFSDKTWRVCSLMSRAAQSNADVVFAPTPSILPGRRIPVVSTVHDLSVVRIPHQMRKTSQVSSRFFLSACIAKSAKIITVSQYSRRELMEVFDVEPERVEVVYLGVDRKTFNPQPISEPMMSELRRRLSLSRPYLFHHGTLQPRKNLINLIRAHRALLEQHPSLRLDLVLTGPKGWLYEPILKEAALTSCARGRVLITGVLPAEELTCLIKDCELAVIPSLYEGFCLPMLEVMACRMPLAASETSCFPEISRGALRYFNPSCVEQIADSVYDLLCDNTERRRLATEAYRVSLNYSWEDCTKRVGRALLNSCASLR